MALTNSYTYETLYVIRASVAEAGVKTIQQKIEQVVQKFEGKIITTDDWGILEMAYEIDDERSGHYIAVVYTGKPGVVDEIERHFRISEDVIRFITTNVPADYDYEKMKKQLLASEEEVKKNRELRKKPFGSYNASPAQG